MNFDVKNGFENRKKGQKLVWNTGDIEKKTWSYYIYVMKEFKTKYGTARSWITKIYEEITRITKWYEKSWCHPDKWVFHTFPTNPYVLLSYCVYFPLSIEYFVLKLSTLKILSDNKWVSMWKMALNTAKMQKGWYWTRGTLRKIILIVLHICNERV